MCGQTKAKDEWKSKYASGGRWQKKSNKKSYGEENCPCGRTEITLDRVSLQCWGEKTWSAVSVCVCAESAFCGVIVVLQSRTESAQIYCYKWQREDGEMEGLCTANKRWREGRKKEADRIMNGRKSEREKEVVSKNNLARGLWWRPWATQTTESSVPLRQHIGFLTLACVCMCACVCGCVCACVHVFLRGSW